MLAGPFEMDHLQKDWANGLPDDAMELLARAVGLQEMKLMRRVCKGWQTSFEHGIYVIRIPFGASGLPDQASKRFCELTHLDLGESLTDENWLKNLKGFQHLRVLVLRQATIPSQSQLAGRLTDSGIAHLQGLPLTQLSLQVVFFTKSG